ncbi:unnamed protein product [Pleuronectes platessa]|uniref:Uncharacterized protein n=1 Tax=Pleuronectes platessa TaxID=8262 RepID=A0A9N7UFA3_PLEPL|nr:unnamed protein product [Pleuronectes platessa]
MALCLREARVAHLNLIFSTEQGLFRARSTALVARTHLDETSREEKYRKSGTLPDVYIRHTEKKFVNAKVCCDCCPTTRVSYLTAPMSVVQPVCECRSREAGERIPDPEKLVKEYLSDDKSSLEAMAETVFGVFVIRHNGAGPSENPEDVRILLEGVKVLHELRYVPFAVAELLALVYALNRSYPRELKYTFEALQKIKYMTELILTLGKTPLSQGPGPKTHVHLTTATSQLFCDLLANILVGSAQQCMSLKLKTPVMHSKSKDRVCAGVSDRQKEELHDASKRVRKASTSGDKGSCSGHVDERNRLEQETSAATASQLHRQLAKPGQEAGTAAAAGQVARQPERELATAPAVTDTQ